MKTPRRIADTTTKSACTTFSQLNLSTSKDRKMSWSSDENSDGGVMLNSLRPLNHEASSLVSPIPMRDYVDTGSTLGICRERNTSPTNIYNNPVTPDLLRPGVISPSDDLVLQDSQQPSTNGLPSIGVSSSIQAAMRVSPVSLCSTPLHFYRKSHYGQHDHHQSVTPGPFTCTKTRKYKLLHVPNKVLRCTQNTEPNINDLADGFGTLAIRSPAIPWIYSPANTQDAVKQWHYDKEWMRRAERLEAKNPYRGIDMNEGWNRDVANLINSTRDSQWALPCCEGGPETRMKIKDTMNRFSLWAQLEPIEWDVEELKGMFRVVFIGEGLGNPGWARKPGSWWATRKKLFDGHRGRNFLEELDLWVDEIEDGRKKWKRENKGKLFAVGTLKRKASITKAQVDVEGDQRRKRVKLPKTKSEQVMSEKWRARRRWQEKKAGRWTDGTLRMDRMWEEFYWVLNGDDPRAEVWPRVTFTRSYY
ncbi:hypothetical protein N431DRAFT_321051 [Stipitochalara longipes BDJ]|nr:hypothetical protein N431DRAFT_321051 [Stipitochalara longipes BDJ]